MKAAQAEQISHMRRMGNSYGRIAESLGMSLNTVKSFCRRQGITGEAGMAICEYCGAEVVQTKHRKKKRFCSNTCRTRWWSAHRHLLGGEARVALYCLHCGCEFMDYPAAARKYCCHECYIKARFGGASRGW